MFDFENVIDRRGGDSIKWNRYAGRDILPLWVADTDFAAPPPVLAAIAKRLEHGVLGYSDATAEMTGAVLAFIAEHYHWEVAADCLVWLPGLVTGINVACRTVDGGVLTATPVYPPFLSAPRYSGRPLITVDLLLADGQWQWDWQALCRVARDARLLLLCHPHNPVGRCWQAHELTRLAELAKAHDWIVCSDEIHCDLILDAHLHHRPFATLNDDAAQRSITLMAPSKSFNIPGLGCAFAIIPDEKLRHRFLMAMRGIVPHANVLGLAACAAAYREGGPWLESMLDVLRRNRDRLESVVASLPGLDMTHVEATYLAWIDVRGLGLADPPGWFEQHGLGMSSGADFGAPGWMRLNFGCFPATLEEALARLAKACQTE